MKALLQKYIHSRFFIVSIAALMILIVFRPLLSGMQVFLEQDVLLYMYPAYEFLSTHLQSGQGIPLWYPYILSGFPAYLSQTFFFSPAILLTFRIFNAITGYHVFIMVHMFFTVLGTYWFARLLRLSKSAALFTALTYTFCQWVINFSPIISFSSVYPALPFLCVCAYKIAMGRYRYVVGVSGAVAYIWLTSYTELALYAMIISGVCCTFFSFTRADIPLQTRLRPIILFMLGGVLGTALAAFWIAPVYTLSLLSNRAGGESSQLTTFVWGDLPRFVMPNFESPYSSHSRLYIGIVTLFIVCAAFCAQKTDKYRRFFSGLALSAYALSTYPVQMLVHKLPLFNRFYAAIRWQWIAAFAMAILAGYGLDILLRHEYNRARLVRVWGVLTTVITGSLLTVYAVTHIFYDHFLILAVAVAKRKFPEIYASSPRAFAAVQRTLDEIIRQFSFANFAFIFAILCALGVCVLVMIYIRGRISGRQFRTMALALLAIEIILYPKSYGYISKKSYIATPQTVQFLQNHKADDTSRTFSLYPGVAYFSRAGMDMADIEQAMLLDREFIPPNTGALFNIESADGYDNLMPRRYSRILKYLGSQRTTYPGEAAPPPTVPPGSDYVAVRVATLQRPEIASLLGMMNVRSVITPLVLPAPYVKVTDMRVTTYKIPLYIYELSGYLPRLYFAKSTTIIAGDDDALFTAVLKNDFKKSTLVECQNTCDLLRTVGSGIISNMKYDAGSIIARATTVRGGFVVLSESNIRGWHAFIDDTEVPLVTTNYVYQGIAVPAGEHTIRFQYTYQL